MKKHLLLCLFCCLSYHLFSQQIPVFTQYQNYQAYINPGILPSDSTIQYNLTLDASYRKQWVNVEGAPSTQLANIRWIVNPKKTILFLAGGSVYKKEAGAIGLSGGVGRMAVQISNPVRSFGFSLGISGGIASYRINFTDLSWSSQHDGEGGYDPTNPSFQDRFEKNQHTFSDFNVGLSFFIRLTKSKLFRGDKIFGGVSFPQSINISLSNESNTTPGFPLQKWGHLYAFLGYEMNLNRKSSVEISAWYKSINANELIDGNFKYRYNNLFWLGAGVAMYPYIIEENAVARFAHFEGGLIIGQQLIQLPHQFSLSYSYDYLVGNAFYSKLGNTHELSLVFDLDLKKKTN